MEGNSSIHLSFSLNELDCFVVILLPLLMRLFEITYRSEQSSTVHKIKLKSTNITYNFSSGSGCGNGEWQFHRLCVSVLNWN